MNTDILTILGQSLTSNIVTKVFQKFEIKQREKTHYYVDGTTFNSTGWYNKLTDLSISFENNSDGQKLINEITIEPVNGVLSVEFPLGLSLNDKEADIITILGRKPKSKSKSSLVSNDPELYQHAWWFEKDDKRILTALNGRYELLWVRIMSFSQQELQVLELKKNLKLQKNNINSEVDFTGIMKKSPCIRWTESLEENESLKKEKSDEYIADFWFDYTIINSTERLIEQYVDKLKIASSKKSGLQIYNAVKWFIKKMNALNSSHNEFIETLERDELGVFIDETITLTGFKLTNDIDLTEQWREW